jgi:hypothetical protein
MRALGLPEKHYFPMVRDYISGTLGVGDGFIALSNFPTFYGVIRLVSLSSNQEYVKTLSQGLRLDASKKLMNVYVVLPAGTLLQSNMRDII